MKTAMNRRKALKGLGLSTLFLPACVGKIDNQVLPPEQTVENPTEKFTFCLNTSTIRGQKQGFVRELEIASEAGYDAVEIWINGLQDYLETGGTASELKKKLSDLNLSVANAIGFAQWIVDDDETRAKALEQLKREMDMLASIGCPRIAAPPAGATQEAGLNLDKAAERYHAILELGTQTGVMPQLEVWGFSANLHKLSQVLYVASAAGHPGARILPDVYHLFKGGSKFEGLKLLAGDAIEIFHMNDYPAEPVRELMKDSNRVYPGDGVGPVRQVIHDLHEAGGPKILSLELFNEAYWLQDPLEVARTGLLKMKGAVSQALGQEVVG